MFVGFLRYRFPALVYAALLFWASSRSRLPLPRLGLGFEDKLAHLAAYGVLAFLTHRALTQPTALVRMALLWAGFLSALYALTDELHQRAVPGRYFDFRDLAADLVGIGLVLLYLHLRARKLRLPASAAQ